MKSIVEAARWEPTSGTPELPLSAFDLTWSNQGRLTCIGLYPDKLNPSTNGIVIQFEGVHAFMSFDEYSDILEDMGVSVPALANPVPYGGCWPFVEILRSPWLTEVARRDGTIEVVSYKHWAILTRDQSLHVMARVNSPPTFSGWLR